MLNAGVGVRLKQQQVTLALNAQNLLDERVQQHVFGDIISRRVTAQLTYRF